MSSDDDGTVSVVSPVTPTGQPHRGRAFTTSVAISRDGTAFVANGDDTVSLINTGKQSVFATFALSPQTTTGSHYVAVECRRDPHLCDGHP